MNKLAFITASGVASMMLGGCVIVDADVRDHGWRDSDFGYLYGAEVSTRGPEITIVAHSNGCTQKEDFRFIVRDQGDDEFDIGFRRDREDNCKALVPDGRRMTWSFAELGIPRHARVEILNPVGR
jgi:hypothetical protein